MKKRDLGRILVTGADGFIGSHLVETLVAEGRDVTALCIYNSLGRYGWLEDLAAKAPKNLRLLLGDVRDPRFVATAVTGHDTVFHLAALIAIPYSYVAPHSYVETNVSGTLNVAQACLDHGVGLLLHTSTSEVYGTAQFVPITERHPLQGQSPYSATKIGADMMIESFVRSFQLPATTLRPFNTFGPRQSLRAVIPTIISQVCLGQGEVSLGSTTPTRDFNFVSDTVNAFISLGSSANLGILGQTFNAGSGREVSIAEVAQMISRLSGRRLKISQDQSRVRPEASEVERLLADASKLRQATGWEPRVSLEEGLMRTIDWVKQVGATLGDVHAYRI